MPELLSTAEGSSHIREFIPRLLQQLAPPDGGVELVALEVPHRAQTRLQNSQAAQPLLALARSARDEHGVAFWNALLTATVRVGAQFPDELIDAAMFHQDVERFGRTTRSLACDVTASLIDDLTARLRDREILILRSEISGPAGGHIPMLDLALPSDVGNGPAVVKRLVDHLEVDGYLLRSGRSFHFYGNRLLGTSDLVAFLGRALLLAPIVDDRWVAHQLIEGQCALRLSAGREKQHSPYVVGNVRSEPHRGSSQ